MKELKKQDLKDNVQKHQIPHTHKAFGIHKNITGEWVVSELEYTPATHNSLASVGSEIKEIATGGYREFALERFKIVVVEAGFFND